MKSGKNLLSLLLAFVLCFAVIGSACAIQPDGVFDWKQVSENVEGTGHEYRLNGLPYQFWIPDQFEVYEFDEIPEGVLAAFQSVDESAAVVIGAYITAYENLTVENLMENLTEENGYTGTSYAIINGLDVVVSQEIESSNWVAMYPIGGNAYMSFALIFEGSPFAEYQEYVLLSVRAAE